MVIPNNDHVRRLKGSLSSPFRNESRWSLVCSAILFCILAAQGQVVETVVSKVGNILTARDQDFEAVVSKVRNGYVRTRLADGSFLPESYALKEGDYWGGFIVDGTIDNMSFGMVAKTIGNILARQRYVPSDDPKKTKLLITVDWGTANPPSAMPNPEPEIIEQQAKSVQAFAKEVQNLTAGRPGAARGQGAGIGNTAMFGEAAIQGQFSSQTTESRRVIENMTNTRNAAMMGYPSSMDPELQYFRYFVVLRAYDYQVKMRRGTSKLLWEAHFSIAMRGNEFDKQLASMVLVASKYFGRSSGGLKHEPEPIGHVDIGEVRFAGFITDPNRAVLAPDGAHVAYLRTVKSRLKLVIAEIDQPGRPAFVDLSTLESQPVRLSWADAKHVLVGITSADSLCFDTDGDSSRLDGNKLMPSISSRSPAEASELSRPDMLALAEEKLPHRKVTLLGSDDAGRRFLLAASGGGGPDRFFVLDRADDLLYEVDRIDSTP